MIAQDLKNPSWEHRYYANLGLAYSYKGEIQRAIAQYERSLEIARELGDKASEAFWLGNLGNRYNELEDVNKAIEFHEQALALTQELNNWRNKGFWLSGLGEDYRKLNNLPKAIEYYQEALPIHRETNNRFSQGLVLRRLAWTYQNMGETDEAIKYYEQALRVATEMGDRIGECRDLYSCGFCLIELGEFSIAIVNFNLAMTIADEIGDTQMQGVARYGLAQAYLYQDDLINASAAIEAVLEYDVPQNNQSSTVLLGIIALRQGDESNADEAFTRAIAQADEILAKTPDYYDALDAKGLALCGLALTGRGDPSGQIERNDAKLVPPTGSRKTLGGSPLRSTTPSKPCTRRGKSRHMRQWSNAICGCSMNWSNAMRSEF